MKSTTRLISSFKIKKNKKNNKKKFKKKIKKKKKKKKVKGQKKKLKNSFIKSNQIKEILVISVYCYLTVYACVNVQL